MPIANPDPQSIPAQPPQPFKLANTKSAAIDSAAISFRMRGKALGEQYKAQGEPPILFTDEATEILRFDKRGLIYKGKRVIEDDGELYEVVSKALKPII